MGLLRGIIQFTGSFDGLSFYKTRQGPIRVRATGGFSGEAIRTKPNYQRTRENSAEFKHVVAVGKLLRLALRSYLQPMRIPYGHNKVVQLFHRIQRFDALHVRGARTVAQGLQTSEGKVLLDGFEFDSRHSVAQYFPVDYSFLSDSGALVLSAFDCTTIHFPEGSTLAALRFRLLRLDFEQLEYYLSEEREITFGRNEILPPTTLSTILPMGTGVLIGVISTTFYHEVSGQLYSLRESGLRLLL
jgi:hypothetical protein